MERIESTAARVIEKTETRIEDMISYMLHPEPGNPGSIKQFFQDIVSRNPNKAQAAIQEIQNNKLPLRSAAKGLTVFLERPNFHSGMYEQALYEFNHKTPPDDAMDYSSFFNTFAPFEESRHYLKLASQGLELLYKKAGQSRYKTLHSYQHSSLKHCVIASAELIVDSIRRDESPIDNEFLAQCSFGPVWERYFTLFTDEGEREEIAREMQDGLQAVGMYGSGANEAIQAVQFQIPWEI